jgi:diguanylate cyclase (GGDEF)-like protein
MDEESRRAAQDFADRLAVALAASDREAQLYRRAHYDHLTGLPNRQLLHDRLRQALAVAREDEDAEIGVLFIDLDRFKDVNDSLGHAAGDRLLYEAARRLEQELPESVTVARMGGDEFVVLIPQRKQSLRLNETVRQILGALAQPFDTDSGPVFVSASIGVAVFPRDGASAEELLRKADTAMYHAKARPSCSARVERVDARVPAEGGSRRWCRHRR